jgi:hypothetical protein
MSASRTTRTTTSLERLVGLWYSFPPSAQGHMKEVP